MGISGIGFTELLIILLIVVLLFGTKKLGTLGSDLGSAIRGFRKAMSGDGAETLPSAAPQGPAAHPAGSEAAPVAGPAPSPDAGTVAPSGSQPEEPARRDPQGS